jgi:signal transduction histidine kinase
MAPASLGYDGGKREALITLMHRACEEIREIEASCGLSVDNRDLRPRIEYFHDAVRALTEHPEAMYQPRTRLSVEWLTFDLNMLRHIQDKPTMRLNRNHVMGNSQNALVQKTRVSERATPQQRGALSTHYRTYTVFFAALFAEAVDKNFQTRVDQMNQDVEDIAQVEHMIKMAEQGQANVPPEQVEEMIQNISSEEIRNKLMVMLHQASMKKREKLEAARQFLKNAMKGIDQEIALLDKTHMSYLSGQMVLLQESKDIVKKLSGQGLNLAGKFLENSIQNMGQGRGGGRGY